MVSKIQLLLLIGALVLGGCSTFTRVADNLTSPADPDDPAGVTVGEEIIDDVGFLIGDEEVAGYGALAMAVLGLFLRNKDKKKTSEKTAALHKRVNALDDTGKTQPKP